MNRSRVCTALAATIIIALPGAASAQFPPPPGAAQAPVQDRWPEPAKSPQAEPAPPPAPGRVRAQAKPAPKVDAQATPAPSGEEPLQPPAKPPAASAAPAPANAVACSGVFAKDSSHLKIAIKYDSRNIAYGQVDGPEGSKIPGTILFPNDPKRRLEVLWANDAGRSETSVIAINGKSQWSAPKGMKLGLPLAALEKANGRPFKISGFGADGTAGVAGWDDGALGSLPGGCKIGMRLAADPKATPEARSAAPGDKEFLSNDPSIRALKPTVVEILIGY
ncbi:MAG: hypothetical protein QOF09_2697 [Alphaproteobacteria bacterium]|jgi:hypothetical protein|nr:hypothetical protein [Alphaproteobacteria bacterium]